MKNILKTFGAITLVTVMIFTLAACSGMPLTGTYKSVNPDKGREIVVEFEKDGTLVWKESYNILGGNELKFVGTYEYDKENKCYNIVIKAGASIFTVDTKLTAKKEAGKLIINGGTVENETFTKQ